MEQRNRRGNGRLRRRPFDAGGIILEMMSAGPRHVNPATRRSGLLVKKKKN